MRRTRPPPEYRLNRALLWARLWLGRWALYLTFFAGAPDFRGIERTLRTLIMFRALAIAAEPKRHHSYAGAPPGFRLSHPKRRPIELALGDALRRTRHRDPRTRIENLQAFIASIDRWIARTAKRLSQGLGHRGPILTRTPQASRFASAPTAPIAFADSS
ncbi:MAG: hypothetical protein AB7J28_16055 [Hyphomonadaceae bacterium]